MDMIELSLRMTNKDFKLIYQLLVAILKEVLSTSVFSQKILKIIFNVGGLKSFPTSPPETRDKLPPGKESDRSWCHRHTTSMKKLFRSQPITPWASAAAYGQGKKFSAQTTTDVKLGTGLNLPLESNAIQAMWSVTLSVSMLPTNEHNK